MDDRREPTLRLNPWYRLIGCGADEVLLRHGSRGQVSTLLFDHARSGLLRAVLERLHQPGTMADLMEEGIIGPERADDAALVLKELQADGIVVNADQSSVSAYAHLPLAAASAWASLPGATVGVVGSGRVAARTATELVNLGSGAVVVAGLSALEGTTSMEVTLEDAASLRAVFGRCDIVLVALDDFAPSVLHACNDAALDMDTPWLPGYLDGSTAVVGPAVVPGWSPCYAEFAAQMEATVTHTLEHRMHIEARVPETAPVLGPMVSMVAAWLAIAVAPLAASGFSVLIGKALVLDLGRMGIDIVEVLRLPRCPACRSVREHRHIFR